MPLIWVNMRPKCYCEYGQFIIFAENLNAGFTYLQQQEQTEFVKVFLYHFQFINWIAWGQAKV